MLTAVLMFVVTAIIDVVWTFCVRWVQAGAAIRAALASGALYLLGALTVVIYVDDRWMLFPASAGAVVGTWVAVKLKERL